MINGPQYPDPNGGMSITGAPATPAMPSGLFQMLRRLQGTPFYDAILGRMAGEAGAPVGPPAQPNPQALAMMQAAAAPPPMPMPTAGGQGFQFGQQLPITGGWVPGAGREVPAPIMPAEPARGIPRFVGGPAWAGPMFENMFSRMAGGGGAQPAQGLPTAQPSTPAGGSIFGGGGMRGRTPGFGL